MGQDVFKLETLELELYRNKTTNLRALRSTTLSLILRCEASFLTDVIHHDCLGRRCIDKQITNYLKMRKLKLRQRQQEALCITKTQI